MIPGEIIFAKGDIELNAGKKVTKIKVTNTGDRPIQVGSHYHFAETNSALEFDRAAAEEKRLNIPAGLSIRFEPGETNADVELIRFGGSCVIRGFSLRHEQQKLKSLKLKK
ncbi:urease subunit beta [Gelidibacter salicanalis]|uniref:Urease subunit beta n=1 Tax=Gelidibacter salicanalis TaxID=291193 RepID=A0A934KX95_9FLAO|nr:urease subunit beta [Gelidibacter salicanalis]